MDWGYKIPPFQMVNGCDNLEFEREMFKFKKVSIE
ncbi:Uncharacterised protein [Candidatus Tiddalikarchaeum anstoanum]|nr:Uncharacterised protein [Candidatus Tiddalikarchaeum anstoanum]